jgi:hypothetical protein
MQLIESSSADLIRAERVASPRWLRIWVCRVSKTPKRTPKTVQMRLAANT